MSLGSELLVKRHGGTFAFATLAGGTLLIALAVYFLNPGGRLGGVSICFGSFGLIFVGGGTILLTNVFEFYEAGFVHRSLFGRTDVRYRELKAFSFIEEKRYAKGVIPAGVGIQVVFETPAGKTLRLDADSVKNPIELEAVCERIAVEMAPAMRERVAAGEWVAWSGAELSTKELRFQSKRTFGRSEQTTVQLSGQLRYRIADGICHILNSGEEVSLVSLPCGGVNFFPGLLVFKQLSGATAA